MIQATRVPLYEQNPFLIHQRLPEEKKDKLTIKGLPLSVSNDEVKHLLESKSIILLSQVKYSYMRDDNGTLTSYKNGDRFVYSEPFDPPIPRQQKICNFNCLVFHHGKDNMICKACNVQGHRAGDERCAALAAEGNTLAFRGYEHPLSNHFLTPLSAFGQSEDFRSVEHAFFWKMASDLGDDMLAERIKNAAHAGIVKRLSKEMDETKRYEWEDSNTDTMRTLLTEKAKTCERFRNCLIMHKDKILAECTYSKRWGTGLSKWLTERTKPEYWPGQNLLGVMLMEISTDNALPTCEQRQMDADNNIDHKESTSDATSLISTSVSTSINDTAPTSVNDSAPHSNMNSAEEYSTADDDDDAQRKAKTHQPENKTKHRKKKAKAVRGKGANKDAACGKKASKFATSADTVITSNSTTTSIGTPSSKDQASKMPDIRTYLDPITGKRKAQETTPEKNENQKKHNT